MIIDAHTHIMSPEIAQSKNVYCTRDRWFNECYCHPNSRFATAETIIESMDAASINRAVVTGFAFASSDLCAASNDYLIEAVRKYPKRLIGLAAVQPRAGAIASYELERCLQAGLSGVGELLPDGQEFDPTDRATMLPIAAILTNLGLPLMLHTSEPVGHNYAGKGVTYPQKVVALAQNFPDLTIIAAHWGGGLPFYELMPELRQALQNVYYDTAATSYLYRFQVFRSVVDICGAEKILFASDFPLLKQGRLQDRIRIEGGLTEPELEQVLGLNAARLFNIV